MTFYGFIFYVIAAVIVSATAVAITRNNLVHTVVYLIFSFIGTAMLFYLLGAPLLAALEVIIYAGAIMVLFLFVVIMIKVETHRELTIPLSQWLPAAIFGFVYVVVCFLMIFAAPGTETMLSMLWASPREYGLYVLQNHWFFIEVVSLLLLIALVGVLRLGKGRAEPQAGGEV